VSSLPDNEIVRAIIHLQELLIAAADNPFTGYRQRSLHQLSVI
jgi:hypothetical protein